VKDMDIWVINFIIIKCYYVLATTSPMKGA